MDAHATFYKIACSTKKTTICGKIKKKVMANIMNVLNVIEMHIHTYTINIHMKYL